MRSRSVAEEVVQDCFELAWRHMDQLKDKNLAKPWLFQILRREALRNWVPRPRLGDLHQRYRSADIGADLAHSATDLLINLARHAGQFVFVSGTGRSAHRSSKTR